MCMLCVEIQKGNMTFHEVGRALGEFVVPTEHEKELENVIINKFSSEEEAEEMAELGFPKLSEIAKLSIGED